MHPLVIGVGGYAAIGMLFGAWFALRGAARLDAAAAHAPIGFRLLIFPAAAALWPVLWWKLWAGRSARK